MLWPRPDFVALPCRPLLSNVHYRHALLHAPMQASISALPPPDQWNDHVLAHFTSMSADHHRGILYDTHRKVRDILPQALRFGWQHPGYRQLQNVSAKSSPLAWSWLCPHPLPGPRSVLIPCLVHALPPPLRS